MRFEFHEQETCDKYFVGVDRLRQKQGMIDAWFCKKK